MQVIIRFSHDKTRRKKLVYHCLDELPKTVYFVYVFGSDLEFIFS